MSSAVAGPNPRSPTTKPEFPYWMVAVDDYQLHSRPDMIAAHVEPLLLSFPKAFETDAGKVRIYEIGSSGAQANAGRRPDMEEPQG